ncbi:hypothetical protein VNI00_012321 [Paramarasmius palmivorus]|uniref:Uncharacterized protein n=1 Tax=Paramarasmius palmivorus TaxID=297713 RepID=A0AAW0C7Q9_9AGAR
MYIRATSPKHLQQRIVLTGLSTPTFQKALHGVTYIDGLLRLNIRDKPREQGRTVGGHSTITIANRYFTSKKIATEEEHIDFHPNIDPKGILDAFRGNALVHTMENEVYYYRKQILQSGDYHFTHTHPGTIKNGDIVEIQFTLTLIEGTNTRNRDPISTCFTRLVLRSVTLLDDTFSENARNSAAKPPRPQTLKRKVGHEEEDSRETEHRLKRMTIDSEE